MWRRRAAGRHRLVSPKENQSKCDDCAKRSLVAALLVPLAVLVGASFDSVYRTPGAGATVAGNASADVPERVVTVTVVNDGPTAEPPAPGAATPPPGPVGPVKSTGPVIPPVARDADPVAPPMSCAGQPQTKPPRTTPPAASMSVGVLPDKHPGGSGHRRSDRPMTCG